MKKIAELAGTMNQGLKDVSGEVGKYLTFSLSKKGIWNRRLKKVQ